MLLLRLLFGTIKFYRKNPKIYFSVPIWKSNSCSKLESAFHFCGSCTNKSCMCPDEHPRHIFKEIKDAINNSKSLHSQMASQAKNAYFFIIYVLTNFFFSQLRVMVPRPNINFYLFIVDHHYLSIFTPDAPFFAISQDFCDITLNFIKLCNTA